MSYALIDVAFLALAAALSALAFRVQKLPAAGKGPGPASFRGLGRVPSGRVPSGQPPFWRPALAGAGALLFLTAVFDSVMIAAGLFGYRPQALSGVYVGLAPIEDFAYPLAAAVLLPALWRRMIGSEKEVDS